MYEPVRLMDHERQDADRLVREYTMRRTGFQQSSVGPITDLILRIGEIYDLARARAIRESVEA